MRDTADLSAGRLPDGTVDDSVTDRLLTADEHIRVRNKLNDMLTSVCDYCHERLGHLLSAGPNEKDKYSNDKEKNSVESVGNKNPDKEASQAWNEKVSWLSDRATAVQVCQLASMVEGFTDTCEKICGKQCIALRSAFKVILRYRRQVFY